MDLLSFSKAYFQVNQLFFVELLGKRARTVLIDLLTLSIENVSAYPSMSTQPR